MHDIAEYLKFFAGLLAMINPVGAIPIFINLTETQPHTQRNRTALMAAVTAGTVLVVSLLTGESILAFFGITIASFRVGGGILILLMALSMLQAKTSPVKQNEEEMQHSAEKETVAVVPLGVPLLAGPGAISTVILYAHHEAGGYLRYVILVLGIAAVAAVAWIIFRAAPYLARLLGTTGINVVTRIMGLIMTAIGVEFIANGLKVLFPVLAG